MNYQRKSKAAVILSILLAALLLGGAAFSGGYYLGSSVPEQGSSGQSVPPGQNNSKQQAQKQSYVHENVELRRYTGEDGHPYIHEITVNRTDKTITGFQRGMLAFDAEGNPLEIDWWSLDTEYDPSYFGLYAQNDIPIAPGERLDERGGYSLNIFGIDPQAEQIAYVLYCLKEITFEDGTVWQNPDFDHWRTAYEGKKTDVAVLESYYSYEQNIDF